MHAGMIEVHVVSMQDLPDDGGSGSLLVKVTGSCPACHELELSTAEDHLSRGSDTQSVKRQISFLTEGCMVWNLGEEVLRCYSRSKFRGPSPNVPV
ncbi:hypothetical protein TNCV_5116871 [Trichonephila clavipes]|nr:hypothetical protein TNCV_5116871 [Trichonephila clavipes]